MPTPGGFGATQVRAAEQRRATFLQAVRRGRPLNDAAVEAGWKVGPKGCNTYWKARTRWPDWAAQVDAALAQHHTARAMAVGGDPAVALAGPLEYANPDTLQELNRLWDGTFKTFRPIFLGRESPWFHLQAVNIIEEIIGAGMRNAGLKLTDPVPLGTNLSFGGSVTLLLWPPEHGKTALWEDADNYLLSRFPWFHIVVGSEKQTHSAKVLKFVRERFEDDAPGFELLRDYFGPFAPRTGEKHNQAWANTHFDVYKKPRGAARDYSMAAIGMGSSIVGTRAHLLQVDDPQSRKSLPQTESLVEQFRQDWLSRPGITGFTVILMNRVGEDDFPSKLIDEGIVDNVIKVRAWDDRYGWAWPERYSPADYARLRRNVGQDAWERNYLQRGTPLKSMTFSDRHFAKARNGLRSFLHRPPRNPAGGPARVAIGVDPGYGTTAITAAALEPTKLRVLDCHTLHDLTAPEQILRFLEDQLITYTVPGVSKVEFVVVETKAFQQGFITDDRFRELQATYGFTTIPHLTGGEKMDEDIGIPQMALSYLRGEIDLPDADDASRARFDRFYAEHKRWRPYVKGKDLRQDRVMSTWFVWMYWRRQRRVLATDPSSFRFRGLPSR